MTFIYKLYSDDAEVARIVGDHELDIRDEVNKVLSTLSDREVSDPEEEWFLAIVTKVCEATGFKRVQVDDRCNVEDMFWLEHCRRMAAGKGHGQCLAKKTVRS